jgi:hypothetical protein
MSGADLAVLGVVAPLGICIIGVLYRVGNLMGRVDERLKDIERRLEGVERREWPRGWPRPSEHS